jgi:hypothetical protein
MRMLQLIRIKRVIHYPKSRQNDVSGQKEDDSDPRQVALIQPTRILRNR